MKEILIKRLATISSPGKKYNVLRESLQHLILKILDDRGYFQHIVFIGGTALRILYDLRRFSEDMDFSLQQPQNPRFDFEKMLRDLLNDLESYEIPVETSTKKTVGAIKGLFLKFPDILQETKASQRKGEKLHIKLEVDTNPPQHAGFETQLLQKEFLFSVVHHDLSTLCAGKLAAFLFRQYTKGRDVYDLLWYGTRKATVNRRFFESGLFQATGRMISWSEQELVKKLEEKIQALKMSDVTRDAAPFLDDPQEERFFTKAFLIQAVRGLRYAQSMQS
ncbi:MAG: nucleotidyl transferase AbiEii/AbiGii toxin family protein [Deltaproteobacteria bacterium]|nr:nucleotidyl transferase AbiEii/AbiGii toxin family protein [Deltaproteobacteria bacterium]